MKPKSFGHKLLSVSCLMVSVAFPILHSPDSQAASATWNGTTDALWATPANWSAVPVPGAGDTATFDNAGNAKVLLDLGTGITIGSISFNTAVAAAYTIGTGAVNSQQLTLGNAGSILRNSTVTANELFNASVVLGTDGSTQAFALTNSGTTGTLTFAGGIAGSSGAGVKTLAVTTAGGVVISGGIADGTGGGTVGLTKTGAGVLTLSGASSYSGPTTISGILNAGNSSALGTSAVTVNSGAGNQLQLANGVNIGNALTVNGGGITAQGAIYVPTGNAIYSGSINVTAATNAGAIFATASNAAVLTIAGNNTITSAVPVNVRLGTVVLAGSQNYTTGTTLGNTGAMIQFGKTASMPATGTVALSAAGTTLAVNAGGAGEFTGGSGTGTLGGLITGLGGQGAPVTLVAGTSIGIDTTNATATVTHNVAWSPAVTVGLLKLGTGTLEMTAGGTYAGVGAGGFPLIVRQGTLLLNGGTHTVTGEAVVGGTFSTATAGAGYDAKLQIDSGTLAVSGYLSVGRGNGIGGVSSDLVANNAATITSANFSAGFNAAAGNLPKGTITLNGTSSYTITTGGAFNLAESTGSNMTMTLNNSASLSTLGAGGKFIGNAGTGVLTLNGSSTAAFGTGSAAVVGLGIMIGNTGGNGTLNLGGSSTASFGGLVHVGYNTGSGTLNITGGTLNAAGEVRVGGIDTLASVGTGSGSLAISAGTANVGGNLVFARGNDSLDTVAGSGTVSGTGNLNAAGDVILGFAGSNNLGKLTVGGGTVNVGTGALKWLILSQFDTAKGQLDVSGGSLNLLNSSSIKALTGNTGSAGSAVINQTGGAITFYSDAGTTIGGSGVLDLALAGSATSSSTYNLNGGTLTAPQVVATTTAGTRLFNFNGGTLKAAADSTAFLNLGANTATVRANVRNGGAFIDTNGFNVTVAQALVHSNIGGDNAIDGGLVKSGGGILTLTGANTYTGATTVTGGRLALGAGGSVANSSVIEVLAGTTFDTSAQSGWTLATGQTLKGTGTVDVGVNNTLTVSSGSSIAPGASPGNFDLTGSIAFAANSSYLAEIAPALLLSDRITAGGGLSIDPAALLVLSIFGQDAALAGGTKFVLLDYGTTWDGNSFAGLADDSTTTLGSNSYRVDYNDPAFNGTALTLTAVPEASSLLLGGLGLLAYLRRRRA